MVCLQIISTEEGELQWGRARQACIPDLRFRKPTPNGPINSLAEIKFITAGVSLFPRGVQGKGVEKRAALIPGQHKKKLADLDKQQYGQSDWAFSAASAFLRKN